MTHQRDSLVATTLAQTARTLATAGSGAEAGIAFEQALYTDLLNVADWHHVAAPDELDMGTLVRSHTGVHYEFDCALLASDALYIIEAKRHVHITRQHIAEFVTKLLDIAMGTASEIGALAIKPVFVSGLPHIDAAAWSYAVSWGVLLIAPSRPTPWELIASLNAADSQIEAFSHIVADCKEACRHLWRPFNAILQLADAKNQQFNLSGSAIYNAQRAADILEFWNQCQRSVTALTNARRAF